MKINPLFLGVAAVAGVLLLRKQQPTPKQTAIVTGRQTYSTPTSVAAALGAFVSAALRPGATPTVRQDNVVGFDWKPWGEQAAQASKDWSAANQSLGVFTFGAGMPSTDAAWRPRESTVDIPNSDKGATVDSFPNAPVYTIADDFVNNPFSFAAP